MPNRTQQIVNKARSFAHLLRDDALAAHDHVVREHGEHAGH